MRLGLKEIGQSLRNYQEKQSTKNFTLTNLLQPSANMLEENLILC